MAAPVVLADRARVPPDARLLLREPDDVREAVPPHRLRRRLLPTGRIVRHAHRVGRVNGRRADAGVVLADRARRPDRLPPRTAALRGGGRGQLRPRRPGVGGGGRGGAPRQAPLRLRGLRSEQQRSADLDGRVRQRHAAALLHAGREARPLPRSVLPALLGRGVVRDAAPCKDRAAEDAARRGARRPRRPRPGAAHGPPLLRCGGRPAAVGARSLPAHPAARAGGPRSDALEAQLRLPHPARLPAAPPARARGRRSCWRCRRRRRSPKRPTGS